MDVDTILTDDELDMQATSSEEEEEVKPQKIVEDTIPAKKKKQSKKKQNGTEKQEPTFFTELTTAAQNGEHASITNNGSASWDFTRAIAEMKREKPTNASQTSLDEKIRRTVESRRQREETKEDKAKEDESGTDGSDESGDSDNDENEERKHGKTRPLTNAANQITKEKEREKKLQQQMRATSFAELQLSRPLLRATQALNYTAPTPIQAEAIPFILKGRDILASAVTGSGKTAAYLLPVVERLLLRDRKGGPVSRVLIIVPTRELAQQISSMLETLCQFCSEITQTVVVGGLSTVTQAAALRARPDVVIATPGRLIDHLRNTVSFDIADLEILILDEADRLLELGFADELREIIKYAPMKRQTMLFSATISSDVTKLAELSLENPARIATDPLFDVAQRLVQEFVRVRKTTSALPEKEAEQEQTRRREALLLALCTHTAKHRAIIFFQHKYQAHRTCIAFGLLGLKCAELHGNLTQTKRLEALQRFRDGDVDFLFCTDLAARGIDVSGVEYVINFELPKDLTTYIHRVGRTARAGKGGRAISLVGEERRATMKELLRSSSSAQFQSRTIASSSALKSFERLQAIQEEVEHILEEERIERQIRLAEVDANKAENIALHHDEIMSRPKKTWFQSEYEKQELKQQARDAFEGNAEDKKAKMEESSGDAKEKPEKRERLGNRAKRRRIEAREREEKDRKRAARELKQSRVPDEGDDSDERDTEKKRKKLKEALIPSELKQRVIAKQVKRKSKNGNNIDEDGDVVIDLEKTQNRKARASGKSALNDDNFVEKRSRYAEDPKFKAKSAAVKLRKGGKKSIHSFKSKQKFKRR
jgi:ATP-dependent RNA helicase DDX27